MATQEKSSIKTQTIDFENGHSAKYVQTTKQVDATALLKALELEKQPKAMITISGGADGLEQEQSSRLQQLFSRSIAVAAAETGADLIDGGTDSGVMAMMGQGVADRGYHSRLIGVAPLSQIQIPDSTDSSSSETPETEIDAQKISQKFALEPNHSHFVLAQVTEWGEEIPIKNILLEKIAQHIPALTILINGGDLSRTEILHSVRMGWPIIVISGSGRLADEITELKQNTPDFIENPEMGEIIADGKLYLFSLDDALDNKIAELQRLIRRLLRGDTTLKHAWERFARYDLNANRQQHTFHWMQMAILLLGVIGTTMALLQGNLERDLALLSTFRLQLYQDGVLAKYNHPPQGITYVRQQHEKIRKELEKQGIKPADPSMLLPLPSEKMPMSKPIAGDPVIQDDQPEFIQDYRMQARVKHWIKNHFIYNEALFRLISATLQNMIILIPILVTALFAAANHFNNSSKWLALRSSAEAVKREIFRYRAQAEVYFLDDGDKKSQEIKLDERLKIISDELMQSEVNLSALQPYESSIPPQDSIAEHDDGFSRLSPEQYLSYRVENQLSYYNIKTVILDKKLVTLQVWIYVFGGIGTLLAAVGLQLWIALTTALVAAFGTYLNYRQIESKLLKYNKAAAELDNIRSWWTALPAVEQENQKNINLMVGQSERTLHSEFSGWVQEMQDALVELKEEQRKELKVDENESIEPITNNKQVKNVAKNNHDSKTQR